MNKKPTGGLKIITINRKASFNYFFKDIIEAGIVLKGSEIKSVRSGKINIAESYAVEKKGEIFLVNSHIPLYKQASYANHNPYSERKLLFKKKEIHPDCKEAFLMCVMAVANQINLPSNMKKVTGSKKNVILGEKYEN